MGHLAERSFPTLRDPGLNTVQNIKLSEQNGVSERSELTPF